ncbi:hypothetical protein D3C86_1147460 [compost metagenome]
MSVTMTPRLSRATMRVLLAGLLQGLATPAWALPPSAAPRPPVHGIVAQPEPEAVIRTFVLQLVAGHTGQASAALEPGLEPPRPYSSWSRFFEALRGGQLERIEPWRKELWSAQDREYRVRYRVGTGRPVVAYVGIRAHGEGPWRVSSWSFAQQPRMSLASPVLEPEAATTVRASGLPANKVLRLSLASDKGRPVLATLAQGKTDPRGGISLTFRMPASLKEGPILQDRVQLRLETPDQRALTTVLAPYRPRLSARDLGRTYVGAGYQLRYPDAYRLRVTEGAVSLWAPGVSDPVVFLSVLPRPENARQMSTEEYARQFGPLNIESADELVRFEPFLLPDGHPAWLETWQGMKGRLGEDRPRPIVVGPLYLVPLDPDAQRWLMIRCLPGYEPVLDAVARNVTLARPAVR